MGELFWKKNQICLSGSILRQIILLTVRWYLEYILSYRDLVEMMEERGLHLAHTTIMRWVHEFGLELDKGIRPYLKSTNDSYRTEEIYIKVKRQWKYLYRAVDSSLLKLLSAQSQESKSCI